MPFERLIFRFVCGELLILGKSVIRHTHVANLSTTSSCSAKRTCALS